MSVFSDLESFFFNRYSDWDGKEQFEGLGKRVEGWVNELCWPIEKINKELKVCYSRSFTDDYKEMLVKGPIKVWTLCPHHLLPCEFLVYIGYLPTGRVLGLSKLSRISEAMGKRPIMQETYTRELADGLWCNLDPKGVGVFVVGWHGCMAVRGVKQESRVTTSALRGLFADEPGVKEEFFKLALGGNKG